MRIRMLMIMGAILLAASLYPVGAVAGDSYQDKEALETGSLPAEPGSALTPSGPRRMGVGDVGTFIYLGDPFTGGQRSSSGEAMSTVEVGGQSFRPEIDSGS